MEGFRLPSARQYIRIDIDIADEELAAGMRNIVRSMHGGKIIYRVGRAPKSLVVCRYEKAGMVKSVSARFTCGGIEVLGAGQQFVAFGRHPDTGSDYYWPEASILDVAAKDLPLVTGAQIQHLFTRFEEIAAQRGFALRAKGEKKEANPRYDNYDPDDVLDVPAHIGLSVAEARALLAGFDPDCGRALWVRIGMMLHYEYRGGVDGLRLWDAWSEKGTKYNIGEPTRLWGSFGKNRAHPVTMASLKYMARKDIAAKEEKAAAKDGGGETEKGAEAAAELFDINNWRTDRFEGEATRLPVIIDGVLNRGIVAAMYSAGGAGKSTLALHIAVKIALAEKEDSADAFDDIPPVTFLGKKVNGGSVVILTAEAPEEILHHRFRETVNAVAEEIGMSFDAALARAYENLYIVSTRGHSVQLFRINPITQTLKATSHYDDFVATLRQIKDLQLVVIDTKIRYSPAEGMGNVTLTEEITHYDNMALTVGASVLLLHHTNKQSRDGSQTGAQAFRDGTAMFDSIRAGWYLRGSKPNELAAAGIEDDTPGKYLVLENSKNNNLPICPTMLLERDGYKFTPREYAAPGVSSSRRESEKERKQRAAYDAVEGIMRKAATSLTQAEILRRCAEAGVVNRVMVKDALAALVEDGLAVCIAEGKATKFMLSEKPALPDLAVSDVNSS